jgi:hypothetical protein
MEMQIILKDDLTQALGEVLTIKLIEELRE